MRFTIALLAFWLMSSISSAQPVVPQAPVCRAPSAEPMIGPPPPPRAPVRPTAAPATRPSIRPSSDGRSLGTSAQTPVVVRRPAASRPTPTTPVAEPAANPFYTGPVNQGWAPSDRTGEGTIGMGGIGSMGHGSGTGSGQGYGSGAGRGLLNRGTGGPTVTAALNSNDERIRTVANSHANEIRACRNAQTRNRIVTRFTVNSLGRVTNADIIDGHQEHTPQFRTCVVNAIRSWQFSPYPATTTVTYPFDL